MGKESEGYKCVLMLACLHVCWLRGGWALTRLVAMKGKEIGYAFFCSEMGRWEMRPKSVILNLGMQWKGMEGSELY